MLYDFVIDRSMIGQAIGPSGGGFLVDLSQTQSGSNEPPQADPTGKWVTAYLQLRGSLDFRDIYCAIPSQAFVLWIGQTKILIANHSLDYHGDLMVRCVPKDAVFAITLSDAPLTWREQNERAKAWERRAIEAEVAKLQRRADKLAPPEPVPPMRITAVRERERESVRRR